MRSLNPWLSMWVHPRNTLRYLAETNPKYGVLRLSGLYVLQSVLFFLNFWSLGLNIPHYVLIALSILISPALGLVWVSFYASILQFIGRLLKGRAPISHLKAALAWSRLPTNLLLLVWIGLWLYSPEDVFIQQGPGGTSFLVYGTFFLFGLWSIVLFIGSVQEVQGFGLIRSITNVFLAWAVYALTITFLLITIKLLSLSFTHTSASLF